MDKLWYSKGVATQLARPISWVFGGITAARRKYLTSQDRPWLPPIPVVVVGNISVGGTGKTPVIIELAKALQHAGLRPGIVSRGYGGKAPQYPLLVTADTPTKHAGDEPVLLAKRTNVPVVVSPNRVEACKYILEHPGCNVILSDDGLQHYKMGRHIELVLIDSERGLGNGYLLPAGPLREGEWRLKTCDWVLANGEGYEGECDTSFTVEATAFCNIKTNERQALEQWNGREADALAGIGNPGRFFASLEKAGVLCLPQIYPDHYDFTEADINQPGDGPVVMTEKDAVKVKAFANQRHWYLEVEAKLPESFVEAFVDRVKLIKENLIR